MACKQVNAYEPAAWDAERSKLIGPAAYFAVMQAQVQAELKNL
jgi:hypothetical protein